ncbi:polyhydroxyalkanoic acid system family protein [Stakelama tenebrarum]|uniref:Polyhydroxyalkanoic acid system protein n=1 Tax=Stakelama tenebrarum TaxID=2711215 RepID=A0A6G6Y321_9SPHN|nr:polyhydroxyalkanoic acid system family protein [Sphingosinithalassobacter tenebrarum]QIG79003.1 hypothetical protein G5C33_03860 [Sphingosinithalassobacter tenebrarum]
MPDPITLDIPHKLGRQGARDRIAGGIGKLADSIPGGNVEEHHWEGDTLFFTVTAMGQRIASKIEIEEDKVRATVDLPPFLALFADKIRDKLGREAPKLLK